LPLPAELKGTRSKDAAGGYLITLQPEGVDIFKNCLLAIDEGMQNEETLLNELDAGAGDGDTGTTICRGCKGKLQNHFCAVW
jgi:hypothetical protein